MRSLSITVSALAILASCSVPVEPQDSDVETLPDSPIVETVQAMTGYPETWGKVEFWSGEYPKALAITGTDVRVPAHAQPNLLGIDRPASTETCALPRNAVFTPWNQTRPDIEYITFVYQVPITIQEDVTLEVFPRNSPTELEITPPVPLPLKAGDTLTYKTYLGEGYFVAVYDSREYELSEGELPESTVYGQGPDDEEWFSVPCGNEGKSMWISYDEALATAGVEIYHHDQYGAAYDLPEL